MCNIEDPTTLFHFGFERMPMHIRVGFKDEDLVMRYYLETSNADEVISFGHQLIKAGQDLKREIGDITHTVKEYKEWIK